MLQFWCWSCFLSLPDLAAILISISVLLLIPANNIVAQTVKNVPAIQETWVQSLGQEDPLEKGMATHSSILAWRSPWMKESDMTEWLTSTFLIPALLIPVQPGGMVVQAKYPYRSSLCHLRSCETLGKCLYLITPQFKRQTRTSLWEWGRWCLLTGTGKDLVISWLVMMKLQPNPEVFSASFTLGMGTWVYVNDPGIEPVALASPALSGIFFTTALPGKPMLYTLLLTLSFPLNFSEVEFSIFSKSLQ